MSPERTTSATQADARAGQVADELHAILAGDPAREARFWRARAEELAAQLDRLHAGLLVLSELLPARHARLLSCEVEELRREIRWPDPLADCKETIRLEPASVATELPKLWTRLKRPAPR
jgi:hypothetical protein